MKFAFSDNDINNNFFIHFFFKIVETDCIWEGLEFKKPRKLIQCEQ